MQLFIEIFLWAMEDESTLRYHRLLTDITKSTRDPDVILNEQLVGLGLTDLAGARYAHSTSWRFEDGRTLLTYLVWVEPYLLINIDTRLLSIATVKCTHSQGPMVPRPASLCEDQVIVHGLRHIRQLLCDQKDPVALNALVDCNARRLIQSLKPAPSGRFGQFRDGPTEKSQATY